MTRNKLFAQALLTLALPALFAVVTPANARGRRGTHVTGKVNINTAETQQLALLPRVGPSTAKRIVAYRSKTRFNTIRDLMRVKGIGKRTFLRAKAHLTVEGPTTIRRLKPPRKKRSKARRAKSERRRSPAGRSGGKRSRSKRSR
ncbi:MAG: helix-hairpin-helix domain-containing protein [bacterium]